MADHTANSMLAAVRSMRDIVIPALDPDHPLAREQAGLVVKYLEFWAERVDHLQERNRAELTAYAGMARELLGVAPTISPAVHHELVDALATADGLLTPASGAAVADLRDGVAVLTRAITALVRTAAAGPHPDARAVDRIVVEHSAAVTVLQRAWFGPQGWEEPPPVPLADVLTDLAQGAPR
jgi:hypothetical protein